jgi:outer membrane receptor protein involved in Fe transport
LTAGGRYIKEEKDSYFIQPYVNPNWTGLFVKGRMLAKKQSYNDFVPEVTFRYQPTDALTYYVSYREGFKAGGFDNGAIDSTLNADPLGDITYEPETVSGFEGGVKAELMDGRLQLEMDAYFYEYEDLQLNFFNNATFAYVTLNAEETESTGLEAQFTFYPELVEGLRMTGSIGYNKSEYKAFVGPCYGGQTLSQGCNLNLDKAIKSQELGGNAKALAPKNKGNFGLDYTVDVGAGMQLVSGVNLLYRGDYGLSDYMPSVIQESYTNIDAVLRLRSDSGWSVALIGKNLSDEYMKTFSQDGPSTGGGTGTADGYVGDRYAYIKPGRTLQLELRYEM